MILMVGQQDVAFYFEKLCYKGAILIYLKIHDKKTPMLNFFILKIFDK